MDAEYAFSLIDALKKKVYITRDPYGVRPLFYLTSSNGILGICSESKGITLVYYINIGSLVFHIYFLLINPIT